MGDGEKMNVEHRTSNVERRIKGEVLSAEWEKAIELVSR
jgi:hypothetical protein